MFSKLLLSFFCQSRTQTEKLLGSNDRQSWASTHRTGTCGEAAELPKLRHKFEFPSTWDDGYGDMHFRTGEAVLGCQNKIRSWAVVLREGYKKTGEKSLCELRCAGVISSFLRIPITCFRLQRSQHRPAVVYHLWSQNCLFISKPSVFRTALADVVNTTSWNQAGWSASTTSMKWHRHWATPYNF